MLVSPVRYIDHRALPEDVRLAVVQRKPLPAEAGRAAARKQERECGHELLRQMAGSFFGPGEWQLQPGENGKPLAWYEGREIGVSVSHCRTLCGAVIAPSRCVGVDLEPVSRPIHPGLTERMTHPEEAALAASMPAIRLWTLKEAVLKWIGSGLRVAMKSIRIVPEGELFYCEPQKGVRVEIISFRWESYWISIAYGASREP